MPESAVAMQLVSWGFPVRRDQVRAVVDSGWFNALVIGVIVFNAALIGASTYVDHPMIKPLEWACVGVFVVELVLRFIARTSTRAFFTDGWNVFDMVIIAAAFLPASGGLAPIVRILRVFRVLRLVKTVPELRLIVTVLARSIVSMKYIGLLAAICFYVYAVAGVKLFGVEGHPLREQYSSIHEACFTLFRVLTGDNWSDLRYAVRGTHGSWTVTFFHVTWIVLATFVLINLIVGAIINNYQEVQQIENHRRMSPTDDRRRLAELLAEMQAILKRQDSSSR